MHIGFLFIQQSPIVARVHMISELTGSNFAELCFKPFSVIFLSVSQIKRFDRADTSDGVTHKTSPSQYSGLFVSGVPPDTVVPKSDIFLTLHPSGIFLIIMHHL